MSKTLDPKSSAYANFATLAKTIFKMVSHTGIEPVTPWLKVKCSTDWANGSYYGVIDGTWTRDNQCHKLALYQLNYGHHYKFFWSGKRGSNSRHSAWKADALPTELLPQISGRCSRIWTYDPLLPRQVRYRTALYTVPKLLSFFLNIYWTRYIIS